MALPQQTSIRFPCRWGGRRPGAGRKRGPGRRRVRHRRRPALAARFPVHITLRLRDDVRRLRNFELCLQLRRVFVHCCDVGGFRICELSIQGNHIHLICEATDAAALSRGMQRLSSMLARRINKLTGRAGTVFADRYHGEIMRTPRHTRNTLLYVLQNARRHGLRIPAWAGGIDPYSSAWTFDGWRDDAWRAGLSPPRGRSPTARPHSWLLREGWRRHGLIGVTEVPAAASRRASRPW